MLLGPSEGELRRVVSLSWTRHKFKLAFLVEWIDKFLSTQLACPAHAYNWSDP